MEKVTLRFADGDSASCDILGSVSVDGIRYAVFIDEQRTLYIYKYRKIRGSKYKLEQITDKAEFKMVCTKLNDLIRVRK